jgi:transcriptional antiterminator RfaH
VEFFYFTAAINSGCAANFGVTSKRKRIMAITPNWYLLRCKPHQEARALLQLQEQQFDVYQPRIEQFLLKAGRRLYIKESLFPGYLFIRMAKTDNWSAVTYTRGVSSFVRFSSHPCVVPNSVISELKQQEDRNGIRPALQSELFEFGAKVAFKSGGLLGMQAIYQRTHGEDRVILLINLLHRKLQVNVPLGQIEAV